MKKSAINTATVLSLVALISCPLSAFSLSFDQLLRDYLGKGATNTAAPDQEIIKTNINTRQAQLEQEIEAGVRSGQITKQEEAELRRQLNYIGSLEGNYLSDGVLSNWETQNLIDEMSSLGQSLNLYLTNVSADMTGKYNHSRWFRNSIGSGAPDTIPGNQALVVASLDSKKAEIDTNIERGITSRRINFTDAQNFRQELNRITNAETQFLADGRMTFGEEQQLTKDLANLNDRVNQRLNSGRRGGGSINVQQSALKQRINQGIASGRLTRTEANKLFREEARVSQLETQLRTSGGRLSFAEQKRLLDELNKLSRDINKELWDRQVQ